MQDNHYGNKDYLKHEPKKGYKTAFTIIFAIAFVYLFIIFLFS